MFTLFLSSIRVGICNIRQRAFSSKSHAFGRKPRQSSLKQEEIDAALESIVRNNGRLGMLESLLATTGDINLSKTKVQTEKGWRSGPS